ncbi:uncharacterized protein [Onthophagus taurus]|uniref:uncharacterized protein n=1 Tax=Onthophagus taurus TaxID=166361 RepID=UPI0039BE92D0
MTSTTSYILPNNNISPSCCSELLSNQLNDSNLIDADDRLDVDKKNNSNGSVDEDRIDRIKKLNKKRKRNPSSWKQNIRKNKRQRGEEYIDCKGNLKPKKKVKTATCHTEKCSFKCSYDPSLLH